jgi:hypothetical protein
MKENIENLNKITEEAILNVENKNKNKKECPPELRVDYLIANCAKDNIEDTTKELKAILKKNKELKNEFKEQMKWAMQIAKTKFEEIREHKNEEPTEHEQRENGKKRIETADKIKWLRELNEAMSKIVDSK